MNLRPINIIAYTPCFYKSFFVKIHRWPKEAAPGHEAAEEILPTGREKSKKMAARKVREADGGAVPGDRGKGSGDEKAGILLKRIDFSFHW